MKKLIITLGITTALLSAQIAVAQKVTMGTEGAYAPFNYVDDSGKIAGFEIEMGNEACKRAGFDCEWKTNEWDTIIPNLLAGNYDTITAGMSITDERKQTIDFTEEYYPPSPSTMVASSTKKLNQKNISGMTIGVQGATIQAAYAEENLATSNTIKSYETGEQSLADLAAGAVDIVLADGEFLTPFINNSNGAFEVIGEPLSIGGGIGMGLRKGDTKLKNGFNKAIASMKKDGSLNKLLTKYFQFDPVY